MALTIDKELIVEETRLICTDIGKNANKFWHGAIVKEGGGYTVMVEFGRIGVTCTPKPVKSGSLDACQRELNKRAEGKKKGKSGPGGARISVYKEQKTLGGSPAASSAKGAKSVNGAALKKAALDQMAGVDPEIQSLVKYLADQNVHNIKSATTLSYDDTTGLFSTPLGVVSQDAIDEARRLLDEMANPVSTDNFDDKKLHGNFNEYMQLIPTMVKLGRKSAAQFVRTVLPNAGALQQQTSILDSLEASLQTLSTAPKKTTKGKKKDEEKIFDVHLEGVSDAVVKKITAKYQQSSRGQHQCNHLKVKKVYKIRIGAMDGGFKADGANLDNCWQLWHGTRVSNLLSILHGGFIIPPSNAKQCTGRMFGDGIYGSDISTKALNYAYGYWGGGSKDNSCFMFLMDFAMGNYYTPGNRGAWQNYPQRGYDSTYAQSGKSGVQNNEMIVYRTAQCNPKFLIQFG